MTASLHHLPVSTPEDTTATPLPDDMVRVVAEFFALEMGFEPQDIPRIARSSRARGQVMRAMHRIRAS